MNINRVCHSVCGQLERSISAGVNDIYKDLPRFCPLNFINRAFSCLIVHTDLLFSQFTFRFLPPVNSGGTARAVFPWLTFGTNTPQTSASPYPGKFPLPVFRPAARPTSGTTYSRPRKKSSACARLVPSSRAIQSPPSQLQHSQRIRPFARFLCAGVKVVEGNCPAWCSKDGNRLYKFSFMRSSVSAAVLPEKASSPHSCGVFRRWHVSRTSGHFVPKLARWWCSAGISSTVILFSRCCLPMN